MQITSDIQRAWSEGGAKTLLSRSMRKMARPLVKTGSLVFTECDLLGPLPERRPVEGIIVREATASDVNLFEDRKLFCERMDAGHRCFMGIEEATGKLTNYRWVNTSAAYIPELNRYLMLRRGDVYVYDLNTLPEFRRRGIDAYTRQYTYTHLRDVGYARLYAYIHGDNHASLRASRHFLKPICRIWYMQIRGCDPITIGGWNRGAPELSKWCGI